MKKNSVFLVSIGLLLQFNTINTSAAEVLSSHLKKLQSEFQSHSVHQSSSSFNGGNGGGHVVQHQNVIVDITVKKLFQVQPLLEQFRRLGVMQVSSFKKQVSAMIPIDKLHLLNSFPEISWVSSVKSKTNAVKRPRSRGIAHNAADQAMFTDVVRKKYKVDGRGISIGVMSDSFNCIDEKPELDGEELDYAWDIFTGELPNDVTVLRENPFCRDIDGNLLQTDEGRAMMQLIHDVAPGAKLTFYTATLGPTAFAAGILALEEAGVDIIVDDIGYYNMPMFQEGPIAQAVNEVKERGVTYFSSAGNDARYSYEADFTGENVPFSRDKAHDFGKAAGKKSDFYQQLTIPLKQHLFISLQWDDPAEIAGGEGAKTDLDFFLVNVSDGSIIVSSEDSNIGHNPVEVFSGSIVLFGDEDTDGTITADLYISHRAGPIPKRIKYVFSGPTAPWPEDVLATDKDKIVSISINEYQTNSSTIFGHPNATGAIAVGAIPYQETPWFNTAPEKARIESFSSAGGTPILFDNDGWRLSEPDIRFKPEIVAPDNSDTSFFGTNTDFNNNPNFMGTSAAAPNAAALAALLKQAYNYLSPDEISLSMTQGSINLNDPYITSLSKGLDGTNLGVPSLAIDKDTPKNNACRASSNFDWGTGCGLVQADLVFEQDKVFLTLDTSTQGVPVGIPFEYLIKLRNLSNEDLHNVRIKALQLPQYVEFQEVDGCLSIDAEEVSCRLGTVPLGEVREITIKAIASYSPDGRYPFDIELLTDTEVDLTNTQVDLDASVPDVTGDLNSDGCVDLSDWSVLFGAIRAGGSLGDKYDLNVDGKVDSSDLITLEGLYSKPLGASCF